MTTVLCYKEDSSHPMSKQIKKKSSLSLSSRKTLPNQNNTNSIEEKTTKTTLSASSFTEFGYDDAFFDTNTVTKATKATTPTKQKKQPKSKATKTRMPSLSTSPALQQDEGRVLRLNKEGLRGEVPWKKWSLISEKGKFSVYHEFHGAKVQSIQRASVQGCGSENMLVSKFRFLHKVERTNLEGFQAVYIDGVKMEQTYYVLIEVEAAKKVSERVHVANIIKLQIGTPKKKAFLGCYVESVNVKKNTFMGIVLGGSQDFLENSNFCSVFLPPILRVVSGSRIKRKSKNSKTIEILTNNIISVSPFSMRTLGKQNSSRQQWFQTTESSTEQAMCNWSKAIVIVQRSSDAQPKNL